MSNNRISNERTQADVAASLLSDNQLVAVIEKPSAALPALEALKELNRRRSGKASRIMLAVLADPGHPADLRAIAALELGKRAAATHRKALVAALTSEEPQVMRRAAEALGRIGAADDLDALEALHPPTDEVRRSVAFARTLISCRLGLNRYPIQPPAEGTLLAVRPDKAVPLAPQPFSATELEEISANLRRVLPAIPLSPQGALRFACGKNRFLIVFHKQMHGWKTLAPLKKRNAVMAVVLKRSQVLGSYFVYEYILSEPSSGNGLCIYGVRPSGTLTHYGQGDIEGGRTSLWLRTVDTPYSPPIDLKLDYEHEARKLDFVSALLQPQPSAEQKQPREPKRLLVPIG